MTGRRPNEARPSDATRPKAWRLDYRAGSHPTEFTQPDQFSDEDGEPWEAPGQYAVFATYVDEDGNRREVSDEPFIIYLRTASPGCTEGAFVGGDEGGLRDREVDGESIAVYSGKWLPDADFERIRKQARFDRRFPTSLDDRAGVIADLEMSAADTGANRYHVIMQAIFRARNLGYPQSPFIDDLVEDALFAAMQARRNR